MFFQKIFVNTQTQIAIWQIEESERQLTQLYEPNAEERAELGTFQNENRRKAYLSARLALREALGEVFVLEKQASSKPFLPQRLDCEISLTHTKGFAAAMVNSNKQKVGIDLEWIRPKIRAVKNKFLEDKEQVLLEKNRTYTNELQVLTQVWSAKEAIYKCYGEKGLDFKKNMQVIDFKDNVCIIHLNTVNLSKNIAVHIRNIVEGLVLVWCIEPNN